MKKKELKEKVNEIIDMVISDLVMNEVQSAPIQLAYIDYLREEVYDTTRVKCMTFRNKGDQVITAKGDILVLNLGNMISTPLEVGGVWFKSSECAYISAVYSLNTEDCMNIQRQLSIYPNGLKAKRVYRNLANEHSVFQRGDWDSFNIEFMKYVILCKIRSNAEFRNLLLSIPDNAMLIEDVSFLSGTKKLVWGAENIELKRVKEVKLKLLKQRLSEDNIPFSKRYKQMLNNRILGIGCYCGKNLMGKILTEAVVRMKYYADQPEIIVDYELLNSKDIYWFGNKLVF
jgi:predicted NAD-dependent protein-ADP-ribosyltransferase YbiA (DUF1768 family)